MEAKNLVHRSLYWLLLSCALYFFKGSAATSLQRPRLSTAETAAEYESLAQNLTDWYFSNEEIEVFLHGLADAHSDLVSVFSIGESSSGAPLLAIDVGTSAGELYDPSVHLACVDDEIASIDCCLQ